MAVNKKRGLGRGLEALLGNAVPEPVAEAPRAASDGGLRMIPLDLIRRGRYQPRHDMHTESLDDLAASIRAQGIIQPVVVRPLEGGGYEIIAGERRWRAAQIAGLSEIPTIVRDVPDNAAIAMALIENIQREALNPLEEASALQRLIREFEMTHQQAAEAVGRSRAAVSNLLRLLELNPDVRELVENGQLEMGHARALLGLTGGRQSEAAQRVVAQGLSVRATEALVAQLQKDHGTRPAARAPLDPNVRQLQHDLGETLGAVVQIQQRPRGKGRLIIQYNSLDELDGILSHIK
jgi:ParB family chromosome partitioning protein